MGRRKAATKARVNNLKKPTPVIESLRDELCIEYVSDDAEAVYASEAEVESVISAELVDSDEEGNVEHSDILDEGAAQDFFHSLREGLDVWLLYMKNRQRPARYKKICLPSKKPARTQRHHKAQTASQTRKLRQQGYDLRKFLVPTAKCSEARSHLTNAGPVDDLKNAGSVDQLTNAKFCGVDQLTNAKRSDSVDALTNVGSIDRLTNARSVDTLTNAGSVDQLTNARFRRVDSVDRLTNAGSVDNLTNSGPVDALTNAGSVDQLTNARSSHPDPVDLLTNAGSVDKLTNAGSVDALTNAGSVDQLTNAKLRRADSVDQLTNASSVDRLATAGSIDALTNAGSVDQLTNATFRRVDSVDQLTNAGSVDRLTTARSIDALTNAGPADQLTNARFRRVDSVDLLTNAGSVDKLTNAGSGDALTNAGSVDQLTNAKARRSDSVDLLANAGSVDKLTNAGSVDQLTINSPRHADAADLLMNAGSIDALMNAGSVDALTNAGSVDKPTIDCPTNAGSIDQLTNALEHVGAANNPPTKWPRTYELSLPPSPVSFTEEQVVALRAQVPAPLLAQIPPPSFSPLLPGPVNLQVVNMHTQLQVGMPLQGPDVPARIDDRAGTEGPSGRTIAAERVVLNSLEALGFSRQQVSDAFELCDRNEEMAANYLLETATETSSKHVPPDRRDPSLLDAIWRCHVTSQKKDIDVLFRARLVSMVVFLRLYTEMEDVSWVEASVRAAFLSSGWGKHLARNIRRWVRQHLKDKLYYPINLYGTWKRSIISDEDFSNEIHSHLQGLGKEYLSAKDVQDYLNQPGVLARLNRSKSITLQTARKWMNAMGYRYGKAPNGMYVDGHEREDVVDYRQHVFLPLWTEYEAQMEAGTLVLVTHDESTFYANDQRKYMWVHNSTDAKPHAKGDGLSIMVSDFCTPNGWLRSLDGTQEARIYFKAGKNRDGYFTHEDLYQQVSNALIIFESCFPDRKGLFCFDNATSHQKRAPDALSARHMTRNPGWKARETSGAPPMRPAQFSNGLLQPLYFSEDHPTNPGKFKGMAQILTERGFDVQLKLAQCEGFKCKDISLEATCCCRRILFNQPDFRNQKSALEELIEGRGHHALFYPKFHCEVNFVEQCWGYGKSQYRMMKQPENEAQMIENIKVCLDSIPVEYFRKYANWSARFVDAYRKGLTGPQAQWANRKYHSHRVLPDTILAELDAIGL